MTTKVTNADDGYLTGQCLIAMPSMTDPRFEHAVVYICAHTPEGAMGLIVNRLLDVMSFPDLLEQLNIEPSSACPDIPIHFGGPVEEGRGFVLHSSDFVHPSSLVVDETFTLTANLDVLKAMADGRGPRRTIMALGYAGWSAEQLDEEIRENTWLTVEADEDLVFAGADEDKWANAIRKLGISPSMLASSGGHA